MFTIRRIWIPLAAAALALAAFSAQGQETKFTAKLTGAAQLPEPTNSKAEGELTLVIAADGSRINYTLTVKNLQNASGADLHFGGEFANGPSVVKLFPLRGAAPKKGEFSGVLAEGTITAADLAGPMKGASMADFIDEIREGETYVNIHTSDGADPPNSGPGDYRLGEIRGQIK